MDKLGRVLANTADCKGLGRLSDFISADTWYGEIDGKSMQMQAVLTDIPAMAQKKLIIYR